VINSSSIGAVDVAPSNHDVVYIGGGRSGHPISLITGLLPVGNIIPGRGRVQVDRTAGKTWDRTSYRRHAVMRRSACIRRTGSRLSTRRSAPRGRRIPMRGVYRSKDAARGVFFSWGGGDGALPRSEDGGKRADSIDTKQREVGMPRCGRLPTRGRCRAAGRQRIVKSTDGGDHWTDISRKCSGCPTGALGQDRPTVSGRDFEIACTRDRSRRRRILPSQRRPGATWTKVNEPPRLRQRAFYTHAGIADPNVKDTVSE